MDIFLDMTGTITDMESENYAFLKMSEAIGKRFSIDISSEEIMRHILNYRKPYMEKRHIEYYPIRNLIVRAIEQLLPRKLSSEEALWIMNTYAEFHAKYVKLAPEAMNALKKMRSICSHMGLITDADTPYTMKVLSALKIESFFDSVVTAEDAGVGKPNPKIFRIALQKSSEKIKIYIGDSEQRDIVGAKRMGMIVIKIGETSNLADYVAFNLKEAAEIIENLIQ